MATIKEIAQILNLSSATVSRVLNYDETISVSAETRKAIFETADKIGYKKKVIYPKIDNVVLLYWIEDDEELENAYYQAIKKELLAQAKRSNVHITVIDKAIGLEAIPGDVSGFIGIGWFGREELNRLYEKCKCGVFIDSSPDEKLFDAVRPNLDSFVTQMVDFFAGQGYQSIGFLGGTDRNIDTGKPSMDIREWSFRQSAEYYGILDEENIYIASEYSVQEGYRQARRMIEKGNVPSALCVASDTLAVGLLQALNEANIRIPDEVAVFSINDVSVARYVSPPLTTFHIDVAILCESALELIRNKILNGGVITKSIFVNGLPVIRKSTK